MNSLELSILDVVYGGRGLARQDGRVVFVPGAIAGETVRAEIVKPRKNYAEARLVEVLHPSPHRIRPVCPLAGTCPGCCYQHMTYAEEVRTKQAQLENFLSRTGMPGWPGALVAPTPAPAELGYRNKIVLHASGSALGYYGEDNRTILDVPQCPLAVEPINRELARVREDATFRGALGPHAAVNFRYTEPDGVVVNHDGDRRQNPWLTERTELGRLRVADAGFFQVNPAVAGKLTGAVVSHLQTVQPRAVIDLYCGVGVFALLAGRMGISPVIGVDSDARSIRAAQWNAKALGVAGVEFLARHAGPGLAEAVKRLGADQAALVLDPPRQGLMPDVRQRAVSAGFRAVIYISCAPDTLARDLAAFRDAGYRLTHTQCLDMFPRTSSFESVTLLTPA